MKRISYYISIIVIVSLAVILWWIFQKYFRQPILEPIMIRVERGDIQEVVKVRGEVVDEKDFNLGFTSAGTVSEVFVKEGQNVSANTPLIRLETIDLKLERDSLNAILAQKQASLDKLLAGATIEDIKVYETKVEGAKVTLENTKKILVDKLQDAFTRADDGTRNQIDQFYDAPGSLKFRVRQNISDAQLRNNLEMERVAVEKTLKGWSGSLGLLNTSSNLGGYLVDSYKNLDQVKELFNKVSTAINSLTANSDNPQATLDAWRSDVSSARTSVNLAIYNLSVADEKVKGANSALQITEKELGFKSSGARPEDVDIAKASIEEVKIKIAIVDENIRKSTIYSPANARVTKVFLEIKESYILGSTAISLSTATHKIQSDVSELDIGKIREFNGNIVSIKFDAFPDETFSGKVTSIEPKEIVEDEDKYYRVNFIMGKHGESIRTGMNADLVVMVSSKTDVLKIPELAISKQNDKSFVNVIKNGKQEEVPIKTGISDGDFIEVLSGLTEDQTLVVADE